MRIRYVVSSMIFWWRENHLSFEQECQFLKSHGFGVELWPTLRGLEECRYERRNWPRLMSATEDMLVSMRSMKTINGDLSLAQWQMQLECAKTLGANIVTDLASLGLPVGKDVNGLPHASEIVKMADGLGVMLCVETGPLEDVLRVGDKFDSIRFCLDTGYANVDRKYDFKGYVDRLAARVAHLHLTDNYGQIDDHQPPGLKGGITLENWHYLLEALEGYDNELIGSLEMYPCMPAVMLRQATEFLFDELKWPNRPERHPDHMSSSYNPI